MSKLYVDEMRGNTSTTISIPSGQTLNVAGTLTATSGTISGGPAISGNSTVPTGSKIVGADAKSIYAPGMVINVVSATKTDSQSFSMSDSFADITGLSLSITPKATNSKIMLWCNISHSSTQNNSGISFKVLRNSTVLGGSEGSRTSVSFFGGPVAADNNMAQTTGWNYLDSPNTTSAITYKIQCTLFNAGQTFYVNTNLSRGGQAYDDIATSTITAMEIAQ